jgi:hypothetical protein
LYQALSAVAGSPLPLSAIGFQMLLFNHLSSNLYVTSSRVRLTPPYMHPQPNDEKWASINLKKAGKCCQSHYLLLGIGKKRSVPF